MAAKEATRLMNRFWPLVNAVYGLWGEAASCRSVSEDWSLGFRDSVTLASVLSSAFASCLSMPKRKCNKLL